MLRQFWAGLCLPVLVAGCWLIASHDLDLGWSVIECAVLIAVVVAPAGLLLGRWARTRAHDRPSGALLSPASCWPGRMPPWWSVLSALFILLLLLTFESNS